MILTTCKYTGIELKQGIYPKDNIKTKVEKGEVLKRNIQDYYSGLSGTVDRTVYI